MASSQQRQIGIATTLILLLTIVARQADAWWFFSDDHQHQQTTATPAAPPTYGQAQAQSQSQQQQSPAPPAQEQQQHEIRAIAQFDLDGVKGAFKFAQRSAREPTRVEYDLRGLKGNNKLYHVHVRPVPQHNHDQVKHNSSLIGQLCADPATGGHLNPHKITQKLPPKSAPFDRYEIGDLSGKHGPLLELAGHPDHYVGTYTDDKLPMTGEHSIVGRSIVIHKNDGARWVCASIVPVSA